ncbi:DMT family transporter [Marinobacterium rhizophilum]|uniref:DMT family transporter n=1 Tax=Marinobacterium rhizophilum TaxID=420402 RepID=A0ABY5HDU3_9GAMM|nr:DMT family transporter [Marinobacterium rhizophilum]UTW10269.1 DMT family transporter [Marinobacterium rhizophilum]
MDQYRGETVVNATGLAAMAVTLLIWVGFLLSLRAQSQSPLTPTDLALLRFGLPALCFMPWLLRHRAGIGRIRPGHGLMLLLGGLPFFYLLSWGSSLAPVAHAGALVPGTAPLFVTGLAVLLFGEPLPRRRLLGLLVILGGVLLLLGNGLLETHSGYWRGHLAFLGASLLWAFYTLGLRVLGIGALPATALLCSLSSLGLLLLMGLGLVESTLLSVRWAELWPYLLTQGLGAGIVGGFSYGVAIRQLGAEKTAALGSFTPALAALAAIPVLGETLPVSTLGGVSLIMLGVLLASGVLARRQAAVLPGSAGVSS